MLDLMILNGTTEADRDGKTAIGIRGNRIDVVGDNDTVKRFADDRTEVIDAAGGSVLPGFTDCHVHMTHVSRYTGWACCENVDSVDRLVEALGSSTIQPNGWICGYNYHHRSLREKRHPTRQELDRVSATIPVAVSHSSGHFWVFNTPALERLAIAADESAELVPREPTGHPVGLVGEDAVARWVYPILGFYDSVGLSELYRRTSEALNRLGLTTVHQVEIESRDELLAWQELRRRGGLSLRVRFVITEGLMREILESGIASGFGDDWLKVGFLKLYIDGSVMGGTAALAEPYSNNPSRRGELRTSPEDARKWVRWAHRDGYQFTAHVMGERATDVFLDAVDAAQKEFPRADARHRLEHISLASASQLDRIRSLDMHASIQPSICQCHVYGSYGDVVETIGAMRARRLNDFRAMANAGLRLAGGSDAPSGTINPLEGIHCAVNYTFDPEGREKSLSVAEAVEIFTKNGPWSTKEEGSLGCLEPGYLADVVVLSDDIFAVRPERIRDLSVHCTVVDGRVVSRKGR